MERTGMPNCLIELQGDETSEFEILGLVNHTHPAAPQFFENAVVRNGLADHRRKDSDNRRDGCRAKSTRTIGAVGRATLSNPKGRFADKPGVAASWLGCEG